MKNISLLLLSALLLITSCKQKESQTNVVGTIWNQETQTVLSGVLVRMGEGKAYTDQNGQFSFTLPDVDFPVELTFSLEGFMDLNSGPIAATGGVLPLNFYMIPTKAQMQLSTTMLDFGPEQSSLDLVISSSGTAPLQWSITEVALPTWLTVSLSGGTLGVGNTVTVKFTADRSALELGSYDATIPVYGGENPVEITAKISREEAIIAVDPLAFDFGYSETEMSAIIKNTGNAALNWEVDATLLPAWLSLSANTGIVAGGSSENLKFFVDRGKMEYGKGQAIVALKSNAGDLEFSIVAVKEKPSVALSVNALDFGIEATQKAVTVSNSGLVKASWAFAGALPACLSSSNNSGSLEVGEKTELIFTLDRDALDFGTWTYQAAIVCDGVQHNIDFTAEKENPVLKVNPMVLDFGPEYTSVSTILSNEYNAPLEWQITRNLPSWLSVSATGGTLEPKSTFTLTYTADRSLVEYGETKAENSIICGDDVFTLSFTIRKIEDVLSISPESFNFGQDQTTGTITVSRLSGLLDMPFRVSVDSERLSVEPATGTITDSNPSMSVNLTLNKDNLAPGEYISNVIVSYAKESITIPVSYSEPVHDAAVTTLDWASNEYYQYSFKGRVDVLGGGSAKEYGHCWGTTPDPDLSGSHTSYNGGIQEGQEFSSNAGALDDGTWYYRAYLRNEAGLFFGETKTFSMAHQQLTEMKILQTGVDLYMSCNIPNLDMGALSRHGFIVSSSETPSMDEVDDIVIDLGTRNRAGMFNATQENLERGLTWFVRAFAVNEAGISYSDVTSVYFKVYEPFMMMGNASDVGYYEMTVSADVSDLGSESIIEHGHCWGTQDNPDVNGKHSSLGALSQTGIFTSKITDLAINTPYKIRAYLVTEKAIYYSEQMTVYTNADASVIEQENLLYYVRSTNNMAQEWTGKTGGFYVSPGMSYTDNTPGASGQSLVFNGRDGYLFNKGSNPVSGHTSISVNLWLRFPSLLNNNKDKVYPFLGSMNPGGMYMALMYESDSWYIYFRFGKDLGTFKMALPSIAGVDISGILGTDWHMLSFTLGNGKMNVYLDGESMSSNDVSFGVGSDDNFVIGAHAATKTNVLSQFLTAHMDHIRVYGTILPAPTVKRLYNAKQ